MELYLVAFGAYVCRTSLNKCRDGPAAEMERSEDRHSLHAASRCRRTGASRTTLQRRRRVRVRRRCCGAVAHVSLQQFADGSGGCVGRRRQQGGGEGVQRVVPEPRGQGQGAADKDGDAGGWKHAFGCGGGVKLNIGARGGGGGTIRSDPSAPCTALYARSSSRKSPRARPAATAAAAHAPALQPLTTPSEIYSRRCSSDGGPGDAETRDHGHAPQLHHARSRCHQLAVPRVRPPASRRGQPDASSLCTYAPLPCSDRGTGRPRGSASEPTGEGETTIRVFGWEIAHAAVSPRPPISLDTMVARTRMDTYDAERSRFVLVQGPISVAPAPNPHTRARAGGGHRRGPGGDALPHGQGRGGGSARAPARGGARLRVRQGRRHRRGPHCARGARAQAGGVHAGRRRPHQHPGAGESSPASSWGLPSTGGGRRLQVLVLASYLSHTVLPPVFSHRLPHRLPLVTPSSCLCHCGSPRCSRTACLTVSLS
jgi:hypothetical protein